MLVLRGGGIMHDGSSSPATGILSGGFGLSAVMADQVVAFRQGAVKGDAAFIAYFVIAVDQVGMVVLEPGFGRTESIESIH